MKLSNADHAVVEIAKLREYCLNPEHIRGKHKVRVFAAALGLEMKDAALLKNLLLDAAHSHDATLSHTDEYGERYIIDFEIYYAEKRAMVRSIWIVRHDENFPRLTSCYVL